MDHLGLKMTRCCHFEHLLPIFASWRMVMGESCGMANYPIIRYADADVRGGAIVGHGAAA